MLSKHAHKMVYSTHSHPTGSDTQEATSKVDNRGVVNWANEMGLVT